MTVFAARPMLLGATDRHLMTGKGSDFGCKRSKMACNAVTLMISISN